MQVNSRNIRISPVNLPPLLLVAILTMPTLAFATMVLPARLSDCLDKAETVVIGTVARATYSEVPEMIITTVTLRDLTTLKGTTRGDSVVLRVRGGIVDGVRQWTLDLPQLEVGKRYALALKKGNGTRQDGYLPFAYFNQGVFPVARDSITGVVCVHDVHHRPMIRIENGYAVVVDRSLVGNRGNMARPGEMSSQPDTAIAFNGRVGVVVVPRSRDTGQRVSEGQFIQEVRRILNSR